MRDYKQLVVWQRAHALTVNVRRATRSFPKAGYSALLSQILRAAESIPTNIVEGCFSSSQKDFARFLDISIKSTGELEYQLRLARDYGILGELVWLTLTKEIIEIRRMLIGLRRRVSDSHKFPSASAS